MQEDANRGYIVIGASDILELTDQLLATEDFPVLGYLSTQQNNHSLYPAYTYLGGDENIGSDLDKDCRYVLSLSDNNRRLDLFSQINAAGREIVSLIHPSASIHRSAEIGPGATILDGAVISTKAVLGQSVFVNYSALIGHDVVVENGAFISPGARLLGEVKIGERTNIGTNAVIHPQVKIGKDVKIGAGALILRDVPDGVTVIAQMNTRQLKI